MGHAVVRQPDGLLAVWSSVVDDFVVVNATLDEIARLYAEEAYEREEGLAREACARAMETGTSSRRSDPMTWERACEIRRARGVVVDPREEPIDEEVLVAVSTRAEGDARGLLLSSLERIARMPHGVEENHAVTFAQNTLDRFRKGET